MSTLRMDSGLVDKVIVEEPISGHGEGSGSFFLIRVEGERGIP